MKKQCAGTVLSTKKQCKNNAVEDTDFCYRHGAQPMNVSNILRTSLSKKSKPITQSPKSPETKSSMKETSTVVKPKLKQSIIKLKPKSSIRSKLDEIASHTVMKILPEDDDDDLLVSETNTVQKNTVPKSIPKKTVKFSDQIEEHSVPHFQPRVSEIISTIDKQRSTKVDQQMNRQVLKLIEISKSMPPQKSDAWLQMRHNMLTASDIGACLVVTDHELNLHDEGTLALPHTHLKLGKGCYPRKTIKMYLREKCEPEKKFRGNSATMHGVKYEHVVVQLYEFKNAQIVNEFGLMPHAVYSFLGASPDGITNSGRMLEIKVPSSREVHGIPPIQYWIQMQMQMECCDLDVCDFVECKISEYLTEQEYLEDSFTDEQGNVIYGLTKNGLHKGCLLEIKYVDGDNSRTAYRYAPVAASMKDHSEMTRWTIDELSRLANEENGNNFIEIMLQEGCMSVERLWWKNDVYSQIEVKRDPVWFQKRLYDFEEFWNDVLKYRVQGIPEHCKAKARKGKNDEPEEGEDEPAPVGNSFFKFGGPTKFSAKSKTHTAINSLSHYEIPDEEQEKTQTAKPLTIKPPTKPLGKVPLKKGAMGFCIVDDEE